MKWNWAKSIILAFVAFGGMIFYLVFSCMQEDVFLVSKDYYKQEIAYQDQIDRMENSRGTALELNVQGASLVLNLPESSVKTPLKGNIELYRPSDARKDQNVPFEIKDNEAFSLDLSGLAAGLWKVKVSWNDGAQEFYKEQSFVL